MKNLFTKKNLINSGVAFLLSVLGAWGLPKLTEALKGDKPKPAILGPLGMTGAGIIGLMSGNKMVVPLAAVSAGVGTVETIRWLVTDESGLAKQGKVATTVHNLLPNSGGGLGEIPEFVNYPDLDAMASATGTPAGAQVSFA